MGKYLVEITPDALERISHVTDETIKTDIADTEQEIVEREGKLAGYSNLEFYGGTKSTKKMAAFMRIATEQEIAERSEFIDFLKRVLEARAENLET